MGAKREGHGGGVRVSHGWGVALEPSPAVQQGNARSRAQESLAAVRACLLAHTAARRSVCPPPQEMIEYANMRHEKLLKSGERAGFLLGDGAGMGKGRQIAGIMFHNLRKGNMKYARPCCCHCSSPLASASSVLAD